jgi:4-amino-4-deoxy-L-arabinose transferase-like glycosyltransferase
VKKSLQPESVNNNRHVLRRRLLAVLFILALAFAVRGLTMRFIRDHLADPSWFQSGSYALFHRQAVNILDGKSSVFWISDPAQTESAIYPPGYPLALAIVYWISGERSPRAIQSVVWILDSLSVLLVIGLGVSVYNWSTGIMAGFFAALLPVLALSGATPMADAPTSWLVVAGTWLLLMAYKQQRISWAICAGLAVGASCWLRINGIFLVLFWAFAILFLFSVDRRRRLLLSAGVLLGAAILVAPLIIRNAVAFRAFVPGGLGMGTNLWEGIGETERAAEFGAVFGDQALIEQERIAMGVPADAPFSLYYPDGVKRDRERARKAVAVIVRHPVWYAGVMLRRMWGMLKVAGEPLPYYGSSGINVTSRKSLPTDWQNGVAAMAVNFLGMVQSTMRYALLPLAAWGVWLGARRDWPVTWLLLATVFYYLVPGTVAHTELRYVLPLHCILAVFAGLSITQIAGMILSRLQPKLRKTREVTAHG